MSVYVEIDVHRKRSQVAIVEGDGEQRLNRNVVNGSVELVEITKQGTVWVRWILAEAAQRAKRDPAFAATYAAIAHRRGRGIATTAIARKLLARLPPAHRTGRGNHRLRPRGRRGDGQPPHAIRHESDDQQHGFQPRARSQHRMSLQHGR